MKIEEIEKTMADLWSKSTFFTGNQPTPEYTQWMQENPDQVLRALREITDDVWLFHFAQHAGHALPTEIIGPVLIDMAKHHASGLVREGAIYGLRGFWVDSNRHLTPGVLAELELIKNNDEDVDVRECASDTIEGYAEGFFRGNNMDQFMELSKKEGK